MAACVRTGGEVLVWIWVHIEPSNAHVSLRMGPAALTCPPKRTTRSSSVAIVANPLPGGKAFGVSSVQLVPSKLQVSSNVSGIV
jgi:hypothetical protein